MPCRFFLCFVLCPLVGFSQQKFTVNGYVKDASNGEELIGVTVFVKELSTGTVSNSYGFYSMTLPEGKYELHFSFVGFHSNVAAIDLSGNQSHNVDLIPEATQIEEVVVKGERAEANVSEVQMSHRIIEITNVKKLPTFLGEADIIKTIQMQPGVVMAGEGTSAFYVRGGSAD